MDKMSEFDQEMLNGLMDMVKFASTTDDMISMTRISRALKAFLLPPDELCIIRVADKNDVKKIDLKELN